jgi:hypothetical protein
MEQVVRDGQEQKAQKITTSLHHLQVQNELLLHENEGLKYALTTKKKHKKKSKVLDLQQREEYHGGAIFWSPSKIREGRYRERVRARKEEQEKLQKKATRRTLRQLLPSTKRSSLKRSVWNERRFKRSGRRRRRERLLKELNFSARNSKKKKLQPPKKALQLSQKGKRAASPSIGPKAKRRRVAQPAKGSAHSGDPAPSPPPKINSRGRKINLPMKFK